VNDWKAVYALVIVNQVNYQLILRRQTLSFGKALTGAVKQRPSDERALQVINGRIGGFRKAVC
jgi:endothelin-converting enzyme/putative endopeptidase